MDSRFARFAMYGLGLAIVTGAVVAHLSAGGALPEAPEIDGGSISAGLGLLSGAILILRARRRSK